MIELTLKNWNLEDARKRVLQKFLLENAGLTVKKQAELLGISERTYYRLISELSLAKDRGAEVQKSIRLLERSGFKVDIERGSITVPAPNTNEAQTADLLFNEKDVNTGDMSSLSYVQLFQRYPADEHPDLHAWLDTAVRGDHYTYFDKEFHRIK